MKGTVPVLFRNLHHRGERGEKGGSANFKTKHTEPLNQKIPLPCILTRKDVQLLLLIETEAFLLQTGLISPGLERQEGLSLELRGVGRHDAGVYVCTASNGVGKPARAEITVDVKCEWKEDQGAPSGLRERLPSWWPAYTEGCIIIRNKNPNRASELPSAHGRRFTQPFTDNNVLQNTAH